MYKITLRNNKEFTCAEGETLVEGAQKSNMILDHSCLLGRCSSCKVKVKSGDSFPTTEELALTKKDKEKGYILSCVRTPETDMVVDAEDLSEYNMPRSKTIPVKINEIKRFGDEIIWVVLRFPPAQKFEFLNGQYVNIIRGGIKRSYSIANKDGNSNTLEFFIKNYQGGAMSEYWFKQAKKDDLLRIEGPKGTFFKRRHKVKNLVFLATGTGIAPVKSILEDLDSSASVVDYKIYLFWGNRYNIDFFWNPGDLNLDVKYFPVLSREKITMVDRGYVQDVLLGKEIQFTETAVYACGSDKMISDAREKLIERGLPEENFFSDAFVTTN